MKNFKLALQNIGWQDEYLINVAQNSEKWLALANMLMRKQPNKLF
jgi:hypothetical protein